MGGGAWGGGLRAKLRVQKDPSYIKILPLLGGNGCLAIPVVPR